MAIVAVATAIVPREVAPPAVTDPPLTIEGPATLGSGATALRLGRTIPRPADAVCVDRNRVFDDPVAVLQQLMAGRLGPIGQWVASDITGVMNIGGPRQWLFGLGDTILGTNDGVTIPPEAAWSHNAYLVQDNECFWVEHGGPTTGRQPSLVEAPAGSWYWFGDGYVVGDQLFQFLYEGRTTAPDLWGFEVFDTDLAIIDLGTWGLDRATILESGPWDEIDAHLEGVFNVETGTSEVVLGVVAHSEPTRLYLVRPSDPGDPLSPWTAWNGRSWGALSRRTPVLELPPGDNPGVRPFRDGDHWYAMGFSWTVAGVRWFVLRSDAMTGPWVEVARQPISPLPGQSVDAAQYWHTLEGSYRIGDGDVLMQWANVGALSAGAPAHLVRPSFTRFRLDILRPDPVPDWG